jgi:fibronectin type 3 domain-containing protein
LALAAGQSTSISVIFDPTTTGSLSGSLTVSSNATNSPLIVALSGSGSSPASYSVSLSWTPSAPTYTGFNVYRSTVSGGPYSKINSSLIRAPSLSDISVSAGQTYYYVATEVDSTGAESTYSAEANAVIP